MKNRPLFWNFVIQHTLCGELTNNEYDFDIMIFLEIQLILYFLLSKYDMFQDSLIIQCIYRTMITWLCVTPVAPFTNMV